MPGLEGFQVLRKLHSQPTADLLLCAATSDPAETPVVVKQIHLGARSPTAGAPSSSSGGGAPPVDAAHEGTIVQRLLQLPPHPNVVRYHRVVDQAKSQLLVMEHCPRGDLLAWLDAQPQKRFPESQALALFEQIVRGVQFLHAHDIAHCDLSLENVLVADDRSLRICDFGLARTASTLSAQRIGKLNYMAPEVVRGDIYDPVQADVWSLGIVLFVLLTGSPLFELAVPEDPAFLCIQRPGVHGVLENWGLGGDVGNETVALLGAMLQLDFALRLRSVDAILDRLPPVTDGPSRVNASAEGCVL